MSSSFHAFQKPNKGRPHEALWIGIFKLHVTNDKSHDMTICHVIHMTSMVVHAWTHLTWSNMIHVFARSPLGYICHQINTTCKPKYYHTCLFLQFQDVVNIPMSPGHTAKITYCIMKKRWRLRKTIFPFPNSDIYRNQCSQ